LQRRIKDWRQAQQSLEKRLRTILLHENPGLPINSYSLSSMKDTLNYNSDFDDFSSSLAHNRTRNWGSKPVLYFWKYNLARWGENKTQWFDF
jgi:hypothetical protein